LRHTVSFLEVAAKHDGRAHEAEEIGGNAGETDLFRSAIGLGHGTTAGGDGAEILERVLGAVTEVEEIGVRYRKVLHVAADQVAACQNEAVGILIRERAQ
jgi:hypothetical protein